MSAGECGADRPCTAADKSSAVDRAAAAVPSTDVPARPEALPDPVATGLPIPASAATTRPADVPSLVTPAATPVPIQPTPDAQAGRGAARRVLLDERFADNARGWPHDPQSTAWLGDGGYRLSARQPGQFVAVGIPTAPKLRDVTITGTFRKVGGPPGGGYGLIVRDQAEEPRNGVDQRGHYYVLEVGDRGEIGIWGRDGDRWVDLIPWTPSQVVRAGDLPNELTVQANGERLVFVVNGVEVASRVDATLGNGTVGVFVGGDGNQVLLHNVVLETPE